MYVCNKCSCILSVCPGVPACSGRGSCSDGVSGNGTCTCQVRNVKCSPQGRGVGDPFFPQVSIEWEEERLRERDKRMSED